ncbi:MAG TPA: sulfur carrier protein ThiS [Vicinamibacterales bacterium]|nr:sulfur carrier protein ThiS [Vicinamibacterales bacterium]
MTISLNGEPFTAEGPLTIADLLAKLEIDAARVAIERNFVVVKRDTYSTTPVADGDQIEIVNFVGGGSGNMDSLVIAGREFHSRLIVGTGKYPTHQIMVSAHDASGTEIVTVAVRRVNLTDRTRESLLDFIDPKRYFILPNTAACYSAQDAIRTARLGREVGLSHWVKLEVIGDEKTLYPDNEALLEATRILVKDGFVVLPYTNDDPVMCRKLEDAGAAAVMPLGAPIGSGLGIQNPNNIRIIKEQARVPVIVDAGVGTASDATFAMELGADAVLMNTAIALADDPVAMARAMKLGVEAGRLAYRAGRIPRKAYASASSPIDGTIAAHARA